MFISGADIRKRLNLWRAVRKDMVTGNPSREKICLESKDGVHTGWFLGEQVVRFRQHGAEALAAKNLLLRAVDRMAADLESHLAYIAGLEAETITLRQALNKFVGDDATVVLGEVSLAGASENVMLDMELIERTLLFLEKSEWSPMRRAGESVAVMVCPNCRRTKAQDHAEDCEFKTLYGSLWARFEKALPPVTPPPKKEEIEHVPDEPVWIFGD